MDGVKVPLGNKGMTVEAARQFAKKLERVESPGAYVHSAIFAWPCVLLDRPPVIWWLSPGEVWDAVT